MKGKKVFLVLVVVVLLTSSCNKNTVEDTSEISMNKEEAQVLDEKLKLFNTRDVIDMDNERVKFLFNTNKNVSIEFYIGESEENLVLQKVVDNYNGHEGIIIEGLIPEEDYYYQIVVKNQLSEMKSDIEVFQKSNIQKKHRNVKWAKESIFYEIFVRSFYDSNEDGTGDFNGITENLSYLEQLGVNALWLMPINDSPSYHGYDTIDYYDVNSDYGSLEDFKRLIQKAHEKDIKVIIDLVVNHSSSAHPWFKKALKDTSEYKDYYVWATDFDSIGENGEWGQKIWHSKTAEEYYMGIFWTEMPDLNLRNPQVREEMKAIAKYWIDLGVDGFRLDASKHIDHENSEYTHLWWNEFNNYVKSIDPEIYLVGENWDSNVNVIAPYFDYMDSSFNFTFSELIIQTVNHQTYQNILEEQLEMHEKYSAVTDDFIDATFIRNHDMSRTMSEVFDNREKAKLAAALQLTLPGTPFIYYGEEIGQKGKKPDENIREPFDWYASASGEGMTNMIKAGFNKSEQHTKADDGISLEEALEADESIFHYYEQLIDIRKENKVFFYSDYHLIESGKNILSYTVGKNQKIIVFHNTQNKSKEIELTPWINDTSKELLTKKTLDDKIELEPYETIIIKNK